MLPPVYLCEHVCEHANLAAFEHVDAYMQMSVDAYVYVNTYVLQFHAPVAVVQKMPRVYVIGHVSAHPHDHQYVSGNLRALEDMYAYMQMSEDTHVYANAYVLY